MVSRRFPLGLIGAALCMAAAAGSTGRVVPAVAALGNTDVPGGSSGSGATGFGAEDLRLPSGVGDWAAPQWRAAWQYERADFDLEPVGAGKMHSF